MSDMLRKSALFILLQFVATGFLHAKAPVGFRWLDVKEASPELAVVLRTIPKAEYTSIQRVGVLRDHALVFTAFHDKDSDDKPADDEVTAYETPLRGGAAHALLSGYHLRHEQWLDFEAGESDLAFTYYDCWSCEAESIFAALHFDGSKGWIARWIEGNAKRTPGIGFFYLEADDPDNLSQLDQVFAVLAPKTGVASVGTWQHSVDPETKAVTDTTQQCGVDPKTHRDFCVDLHGTAATKWESKLCSSPDAIPLLRLGQKTKSCTRLVANSLITAP